MQLRIHIHLQEPFGIPLNYNHQLQSAIYAKLAQTENGGIWHDYGFGQYNNEFKAFVFGSIAGNYRIRGKQICFTDSMEIEVRSPIFRFIDDLQRSFELQPSLHLFNTTFAIDEMQVSNLHLNRTQALFQTASPVIVRNVLPDGSTVYYSPDDAAFVPALTNNFRRKYETVCKSPAGAVSVIPVGQHKKTVTQYKGLWITAYSGKYEISGSPKELEFIYNTGLGIKNAQGFGMLNLAE